MKIRLVVKPASRENLVKQLDNDLFEIRTTQPARDNKANQAIIELLADHFKVKKHQVFLESGLKSSIKVAKIMTVN